ncbi:MAG: type IV pilus secretin PilQ [Bacteriovoracaceae bacterium]|nr:type IV pilus secretin PilQ [Bacteriovoracaceae bacterium]
MGKGFFLSLCILSVLSVNFVFCAEKNLDANKSKIQLLGINFYQDGELSNLELQFDREGINAGKFHVVEDKQIIVEMKDVYSSKRVMRAFDTSEFSGSVVFVSSYKCPENPNNIRVAIQLRDNVRSALKRHGTKLILSMENRFGVFSRKQVKDQKVQVEKDKADEEVAVDINVPKSKAVQDILDNLTLSGKKKYVGSRLSFSVQDMDVNDMLEMMADASGFNIITTPHINGLEPMTLKLTNVPWDEALDLIMELNHLVARKKGQILLITTAKNAAKEEAEKLLIKKAAMNQEALVTKIFPISYADLADIQKVINEYLTPGRGKISPDSRTNSLIVRDTAEIIDKIIKIVEALDTQTPQVLIEAKIVEVWEVFSREIGLVDGVNWGYDPIMKVDPENNSAGSSADSGFTFSTAPSTRDGRFMYGVSIAQFGRVKNLNFKLQLMEQESKGKIITSPKVITQNKKKAVIETEESVSFTEIMDDEGTMTTGYKWAKAKIKLEVTPQVTNEGSIVMKVVLDKDSFGERPTAEAPPDITTRKVTTNVLVENGSTIVIGGMYSYSTSETHAGIPFLKDLPIVGWLFRTFYNPNFNKKEMVIFITPRIINQEEAGLIDESVKI